MRSIILCITASMMCASVFAGSNDLSLSIGVDGQTVFYLHQKAVPSDSVFIHTVYFWLHEHVTENQKAEFVVLLRTFSEIASVTEVYVGLPAGTPRAIVDNSYEVALIVHFRDKAGHDFYQADKIHTDAIRIFEGWIRDIRIYDTIGKIAVE